MATVTQASVESLAMPPVHRFTVAQYHRMIETAVLTKDDRVELLEGWIVAKMPHNPPHDGTISRVLRRFWGLAGKGWVVRVQSSLTLADSEPEPDLAVVVGPEERYLEEHPGPRDTALVVEVADSTLASDRTVKGRLYARAHVPLYWIINLVDSQIEVYSGPRAGKSPAYRHRNDYARGDTVPFALGEEVLGVIPAQDLLP
jgi:Uma2 family endonuclease